MPRRTALDTQWQQLMSLCESERRFDADGGHPRLLKLIRSQIEELGGQMGFSARRIATRDFRAEREGGRITRIVED